MKHSLSQNLKRILSWSLILQCFCAVIFAYSFYQQQKEADMVIKQFADDCVRKITKEMLWSNTCMRQMTINTSDYRDMFWQNELEIVKRISELQRIFQILQEASINHYNFFVYDGDLNRFLEITPVTVPFERYQAIKAALLAEIHCYDQTAAWNLITLENERIITSMWIYDNFVMGSWIEEAEFLTYLQGLNIQKDGGTFLFLKEEALIQDASATKKTASSGMPLQLGQFILDYPLEECNTNFLIRVITSRSPEATRRMLMQLLPILASFQLAVLIYLFFLQIRKNLVIPMRNLSHILDKYKPDIAKNSGRATREGSENRQGELGDAYAVLEELGQRVEHLTTELYQKELQTKQLQLNFRTLQIRPHFFVNCLAMISGMAQVNDIEKIREMTVCLSDYYRYVLRDCMDLVTLRQETEHMDHVIEIYSAWSSTQFSFEKQIADEALEWRLPVLSIGTFLENSIKHAVPAENRLQILLTAHPVQKENQAYLYLSISDDGIGMPEQLVEQLNQEQPVPETEGRHIGINNVIQRLHLLYGKNARLHFTSPTSSHRGTNVEIWIPEAGKTQQQEVIIS